MATAVYPGSFDPITFGHLNIIERVSPLFEKSLKKASNVTIDIWEGLTVDYLEKIKCKYLVRGIRSITDFDHEFVMSTMNKKLNPKIDTIFVPADIEYNFVSSRAVKEVAVNGGDLEHFVPAVVAKAVREKINKRTGKV
jgi:pantetheine-phosphate adenylyltransferase